MIIKVLYGTGREFVVETRSYEKGRESFVLEEMPEHYRRVMGGEGYDSKSKFTFVVIEHDGGTIALCDCEVYIANDHNMTADHFHC